MSQLTPASKTVQNLLMENGELSGGKVWFERDGVRTRLGVTQSATDLLGEVESVELPDEGEDFAQGDVLVTLEGSHGKLLVTAPFSGEVLEVNSVVDSDPGAVEEDPLEAGWLVVITPQNDAPDAEGEEVAHEDSSEGESDEL